MTTGTSPASANTSSVTIDRLECAISLPPGLEHPGAAAEQLRRVAERSLAGASAAALAHLPRGDDAVYRIRRLDIELWVDPQAMSESEIAARWGAQLARAITAAVAGGGSRQVVCFASALDYVRAFLVDLLAGRAWSKWYYQEFRPLRSLPAEAVALQLCLARPEWIAPLLTELGDELIERWTRAEIERLWRVLGLPTRADGGGASAESVRALLALRPRSSGASADARARDALRLWLAFAAARPDAARDPRWSACIHALIDVLALLRLEPEAGPLLAMRSPPYPALRRRIAGGPLADTLAWLDAADPQLLADAAAGAPGPAALVSSVGGVVLLLPALAELGLWERWCDEVGSATGRRWLFALALKALGQERAPLLLGDALLAALAGLSAVPVADARQPQDEDRSPGAWVEALPELAARWYPAHTRDVRACEVDGVRIVRDAAAGHWLAAGRSHEQGGVRPALIRERAECEAEAAHFGLGRSLGFPWLTPSLDAALCVVASLALRRTAARLPGLVRSSPAYVAQRFLATPASFDPLTMTARLQGGPLAVVLGLADLPWTVRVPWLARPVTITMRGTLPPGGA